jgi:hypothetical protein
VARRVHEGRIRRAVLLVVGSAGDGGGLDIRDAEGEFRSPFDRAFFLETFERKCVELKTRR